MKIAVLSTRTAHHTYFINRIAALFRLEAVFYETEFASFPYDNTSPYSREEVEFENDNFFIKVPREVPGSVPVYRVPTVNADEFRQVAGKHKADIGLVFGCGKIKPHVFDLFKYGLINVHRGIVPEYRGLDSDLWAIYNDDFRNIGVTLHYVDKKLDTGDVVSMERIAYSAKDRIYHLRYKTTVMAADMMIKIIEDLNKGVRIKKAQKGAGRYYSAMPAALKTLCQEKLDRYIKDEFGGKR